MTNAQNYDTLITNTQIVKQFTSIFLIKSTEKKQLQNHSLVFQKSKFQKLNINTKISKVLNKEIFIFSNFRQIKAKGLT